MHHFPIAKSWLLGKGFISTPRKCRHPVFQTRLPPAVGRLNHRLRPPLSRRRAHPRASRKRKLVYNPLRHCRRYLLRISLGTRATRSRVPTRISRRHQIALAPKLPGAENWRILRQSYFFARPSRGKSSSSQPRQGRKKNCSSPSLISQIQNFATPGSSKSATAA